MRFSRGEKKGSPDSCLGPKQVQMWYCVEEEGKGNALLVPGRLITLPIYSFLFYIILATVYYSYLRE